MTYELDHFSRVVGQSEDEIFRSQQNASATISGVSNNVKDTTTRDADRSRSRSAARTASENLLVSLDESILPPQITKVRPAETTSSPDDGGLGISNSNVSSTRRG